PPQRRDRRAAVSQDQVRAERDEFRSVSFVEHWVDAGPAPVDVQIATVFPAKQAEPFHQGGRVPLPYRIARQVPHQHAETAHRTLRLRGDRPSHNRAGCERDDEPAPPHSITSSARASSVRGTVRPSALAVLRLMTSSNLVGCCTGRSAGLAPFRILPACLPTSRKTAMLLTP